MSFGGGLEDDEDVLSEINMTPLVDVMLVLLIIFMITVPVLTHSVKLDLPRASSVPAAVEPKSVTLSVTADGKVYWDKTEVDSQALNQRLSDAALAPVQPEIQVRGDRAVRYEHVMSVMAAAQRAGIRRLGFVTEPGR